MLRRCEHANGATLLLGPPLLLTAVPIEPDNLVFAEDLIDEGDPTEVTDESVRPGASARVVPLSAESPARLPLPAINAGDEPACHGNAASPQLALDSAASALRAEPVLAMPPRRSVAAPLVLAPVRSQRRSSVDGRPPDEAMQRTFAAAVASGPPRDVMLRIESIQQPAAPVCAPRREGREGEEEQAAPATGRRSGTIVLPPAMTERAAVSPTARALATGAAPHTAKASATAAAPHTARASVAAAAPHTARASVAAATPHTARASAIAAAPHTARASVAGAVPHTARASVASAVPHTARASVAAQVPEANLAEAPSPAPHAQVPDTPPQSRIARTAVEVSAAPHTPSQVSYVDAGPSRVPSASPVVPGTGRRSSAVDAVLNPARQPVRDADTPSLPLPGQLDSELV